MEYVLDLWEKHFPHKLTSHLAYTYATVFHETGRKMIPVEEIGKGKGYKYGVAVGPHRQVYYGRGHVQLTWEANYIKATNKIKPYGLNADLHRHPDKMLEDEISAIVLFDGMGDGWFTGRKLSDYFTSNKEDPVEARRIVNGTDRAQLIAGYYWKFKDALEPIPSMPEPEGPQMPEPPTDPELAIPMVEIKVTGDVLVYVNGKEVNL